MESRMSHVLAALALVSLGLTLACSSETTRLRRDAGGEESGGDGQEGGTGGLIGGAGGSIGSGGSGGTAGAPMRDGAIAEAPSDTSAALDLAGPDLAVDARAADALRDTATADTLAILPDAAIDAPHPADAAADAAPDVAVDAAHDLAVDLARDLAVDSPPDASSTSDRASDLSPDQATAPFTSFSPCTQASNYQSAARTITFDVNAGYVPACLQIHRNEQVTFTAAGSTSFSSHPLVSREPFAGTSPSPFPAFGSGAQSGTSKSFTFPGAGFFPYVCHQHSFMTGVIWVVD
jgi:plastocyanin